MARNVLRISYPRPRRRIFRQASACKREIRYVDRMVIR